MVHKISQTPEGKRDSIYRKWSQQANEQRQKEN